MPAGGGPLDARAKLAAVDDLDAFPAHTLENVGETPIHVIAVELKRA